MIIRVIKIFDSPELSTNKCINNTVSCVGVDQGGRGVPMRKGQLASTSPNMCEHWVTHRKPTSKSATPILKTIFLYEGCKATRSKLPESLIIKLLVSAIIKLLVSPSMKLILNRIYLCLLSNFIPIYVTSFSIAVPQSPCSNFSHYFIISMMFQEYQPTLHCDQWYLVK